MSNICYVYSHLKPDFTPFYVGKSINKKRAYDLSPSIRNNWHGKVVKKYGAENILVEIIECQSEEIALEKEKIVILALKNKGFPLVNITDGGEGLCGIKRTKETRIKMSIALKGRVFSEETKNKMSEKAKLRGFPKKALEAAIKSNIGRKPSEETRKKLTLAQLGNKNNLGKKYPNRKLSEETKRKISESGKIRWAKIRGEIL